MKNETKTIRWLLPSTILASFALSARPAQANDAAPVEPLAVATALRPPSKPWAFWRLAPGVVERAQSGTPAARDQLVPILEAAAARHALGYEELRAAVCVPGEAASDARARACATLPVKSAEEWARLDRLERRLVLGASTVLYAGAVTAAFVASNSGGSRSLATATGAADGALAGAMVGAITLIPLHLARCESNACALLIVGTEVGGMIAGGVLGGRWAHDLGPAARGPLVAAGLAPFIFTVFVMTLE
jgi:hypothetical protein